MNKSWSIYIGVMGGFIITIYIFLVIAVAKLENIKRQNVEIMAALHDLGLEMSDVSGIMAGKAGAAFTINGEVRK